MISEHKLASAYSSFWRITLPFSEAFTRRMNLATKPFAQRYELGVPSERVALVSEMSFRFLGRALSGSADIDRSSIEDAAQEAWLYISRFPDSGSLSSPTDTEITEALTLSGRLERFFRTEGAGEPPLIVSPLFRGCGLVDNCAGDMLVGTTLYEIKNVDRNFRIVDVRQLLVYCALNAEKPRYTIDSVGLVNGRSGRFYRVGLELLALDLAGSSAADLFADVVTFISSESASR